MLKRVGVLAFVLTAGALFEPAAALAAERGHGGSVAEHHDKARVVEQYGAPVAHEHWNRDGVVVRRDDRVVVTTAPNYYYYYTAQPNCAYPR